MKVLHNEDAHSAESSAGDVGGLALILSLQMAATAPISLLNPRSPSNPKVPIFFPIILVLSISKIHLL